MIDLTTSADFLRRSSVGIVVGILILILIIVGYMFRNDVKNTIFPQKPPPATVAFGMLPKFNLAVGYAAKNNIAYTLQTVTGDLPALSDKAKVFAIAVKEPTFGAPAQVKLRAAKLGFDGNPIDVGGQLMSFVDTRNNQRTLKINSLTGDILLESNYLSTQEVLTTRPSSIDEAKMTAEDFFHSAGLNFDDYDRKQPEVKSFRVDGSNLVEANSLATTNVIQVTYNHVAIDKMPVVYPKQKNSNVAAIVARSGVVEAKIINLNVLKNKFSTYPLKGVQKAYEDLKAGRAAFDDRFDGDSLTITSVSLGYVDSGSETAYLMPVYIFNSSTGLKVYVSAVDDSWIKG
ncbi:hypothetical protein HY024_00035 [Candidatus Curtissbacteria bacterium]|nr:hypothetical protein [Candidatus Curtissbacteria bacterium]